MNEGMNAYFDDGVDYPLTSTSGTLLDEILPFGTMWSYVSSTFANGLLNCGKLRHAVLLNRYNGMDNEEEGFSYGGEKYHTKRATINAWKSDTNPFHLDLSRFGDDVLIVNHLGDNAYLYIWLDCDVSDCIVGRFRTDDSADKIEAALIASAIAGAQGYGHSENTPVILDVNHIRGWISF